MLHIKYARAALAAAAAVLSSQAFAADTGTLAVTATVSSICTLTLVPAMGFTVDPSSTSAAGATSTVQYKCTKNTAPTSVTVGGSGSGTGYSGTLASTGTPADTMAFTVAWTDPSANGNGFGVAAQTFVLNGSIAVAAFQNAPAHTDYTVAGGVAVAILP